MESGVEKHKFVAFCTFLHFFSLLSLLGTFSSPAGRDSIELQTKSQFWNFLFSKVRDFLKKMLKITNVAFPPPPGRDSIELQKDSQVWAKKCEKVRKMQKDIFSRISPFRHPKYQLFRRLELTMRIYFWNVF